MKVKVILTDGSAPIGRGVGPLLEAEDVMAVLRNDPAAPQDLREKAIFMASTLLQMTGDYRWRSARKMVRKILATGKAYKKMQEIIHAQGVTFPRPKLGQYTHDVLASKKGKVVAIDNEVISKIARVAGAPEDKGAGILLHKNKNDSVKAGEVLYTVYALSKFKLDLAQQFIHQQKAYIIQ